MMQLSVVLLWFSALILPGNPQQQTVSAPKPQVDLSRLSEKDLFKRAEKSRTEADLPAAYEAFKLAFAKRKYKEEKKYGPMFAEVAQKLAAASVEKAREALARNDLKSCEDNLKAANGYFDDPALKSVKPPDSQAALQQEFTSKVQTLRQQFQNAKDVAGKGNFDAALKTLAGLLPFESHVPGVAAEIENVRQAKFTFLSDRGRQALDNREWQSAGDYLDQALKVDPGNKSILEMREKVGKGGQADQLAAAAADQRRDKQFDRAMQSIEQAIRLDPGYAEFPKMKQQIRGAWIEDLATEIPTLMGEPNDFKRSRDAYLRMESLRSLEPGHPLVANEYENARKNFGKNSWDIADQWFSQEGNIARFATTYVYYLNARNMLGKDVRDEQVKNAAARFNPKRTGQLVISVQNSAGAPDLSVNAIYSTSRQRLDDQGFPDLRVRLRDEYTAAPDEDTLFQELRPDGKGYTAILTIEIQRYVSFRNNTEEQPKSIYPVGLPEEIPNEEYLKKQAEINKKIDEIRTGKVRIPEKERPKAEQRILDELKAYPATIKRQPTKEYSYRKRNYTQTTEVRLVVILRDNESKEVMAKEEIPYTREDRGTEIAGVHKDDQNGLQNMELSIPTKEEALKLAEDDVKDKLGKLLPGMLTPYVQRFMVEGKRRQKLEQMDEAVEYFLCHWAFMRRNGMPEADAQLIQELVKKETGYDLQRLNEDFMKLITSARPTR